METNPLETVPLIDSLPAILSPVLLPTDWSDHCDLMDGRFKQFDGVDVESY